MSEEWFVVGKTEPQSDYSAVVHLDSDCWKHLRRFLPLFLEQLFENADSFIHMLFF